MNFKKIKQQIQTAKEEGRPFIELVSVEIHRKLGGYPNQGNHHMPSCCKTMLDRMKSNDVIISAPKKGNGATLRIRIIHNKSNPGITRAALEELNIHLLQMLKSCQRLHSPCDF